MCYQQILHKCPWAYINLPHELAKTGQQFSHCTALSPIAMSSDTRVSATLASSVFKYLSLCTRVKECFKQERTQRHENWLYYCQTVLWRALPFTTSELLCTTTSSSTVQAFAVLFHETYRFRNQRARIMKPEKSSSKHQILTSEVQISELRNIVVINLVINNYCMLLLLCCELAL